MTSKARMTFRFEPLPAPKPAMPALAVQPALPAQPGQPEPEKRPQSADERSLPQFAVDPHPVALDAKRAELSHPVIESYPPMNGPYLDDDIRALEEMIRRTDSVVEHIPKQSNDPEERRPTQPLSLPQEAESNSPIIGWKLPEAKERKPRLVRELEQVEVDHEQPERWSLPEEEVRAHRPTSSWLSQAGAYVPPSAPSWTRVILSVAAAIVTGALFGYMVLTLFTGEPMFPSKSSPGPAESVLSPSAAPTPASTLPEKTGAELNNAQSSETTTITSSGSIAEITADEAFVLQYGVFRNLDSAQLAVAQLQDVGLPAVIDDSDGFRVYAGLATTKAEAQLLAAQMPDIEVYVRQTSAQSLRLPSGDNADDVALLLSKSAELGRLIAQITVSGLQDDLPQPVSADDTDALKQAAAAWQQSRTAIGTLSADAKAPAETLGQSLESALASLASYGDKPSRYHLWKAQNAIMSARLADAELRLALQPATNG